LAAHEDPREQQDRPLLRLEGQFKRKKGTTHPLKSDEVHQLIRPTVTSWKTESIAICQFIHLQHTLEEVTNLFSSRHLLRPDQSAGKRHLILEKFSILLHISYRLPLP